MHPPSEKFYAEFKPDSGDLVGYYVGSTVVEIRLKQSASQEYFVWLAMYSPKKGSLVHVDGVELFGTEGVLALAGQFEVLLDDIDKDSGLFNRSVRVGIVKAGDLDALSGLGGPIGFRVDVQSDGETRTLSYSLIREVVRWTVYPT